MSRFSTFLLAAVLVLVEATAVLSHQTHGLATHYHDGDSATLPLDLPARIDLGPTALFDALLTLRDRSGVRLAFSPSMIPRDLTVTCPCDGWTVGQALTWMLAGTNLDFTTLNNRILIEPSKRRTPVRGITKHTQEGRMVRSATAARRTLWMAASAALLAAGPLAAQETGTIRGTVVDRDTRQPVQAAQVSITGTSISSLTDANGGFQLVNVPAGEVEIVIQSIGFARTTHTVTVRAGEVTAVQIEMRGSAIALDEIVVTGTAGQARRREVGQTVTQITMANVQEPVATIDHLLQGRAPGVMVTAGGGTMGGAAQIRLRGNVSTTLSNQPLIYVDGVRQSAEAYPTPTSGGVFYARTHQTANPLNDLNPNDIERIEIVKGAAATTLYGSEAAAGVIQIFTRRGAAGKPLWTYQTNVRMDRMAPYGSEERPFMMMDKKSNGTRDYIRPAYGHEHTLSVSGGTNDARYFLSALYMDGTGIHPNDEESRWGVRGNINLQPFENVGIQWNTAYSAHDMQLTHVGNNLFSLQFNIHRYPRGPQGSDWSLIDKLLDAKIFQDNTRFTSGLTLTYSPTTNLNNRLVVGVDRVTTDILHNTPYDYVGYREGYIDEMRWVSESWSVDYVGSFTFRPASDLTSRFSWGGQSITRRESRLQGFGTGLPGPGEHTLSSTAVRQTFSDGHRVIDAGVFVENMFDFRDRYFLTVGLRVDGNSTFGSDMGLQAYPKASASYVISDESFWPQSLGELRLRGAYGQAGRAPGPFDATRTWQPLSFANQAAFRPANLGNPDLGPERTTELEVGFEATVLNNRARIEFTHYRQKTVDALLGVPQLASNGFVGTQLENIGAMQNRGIELSVTGLILERPGFSWDMGLNVSTNHSKVLDTGGQEYATIVPGWPAPVMRAHRVKNPNEFADPIIEENVLLGPRFPTRTIGLSTSFGLPLDIRLSARGEYVGGFWYNMAQANLVDRGSGSPYCDPSGSGAYAHVPYFEWRPDHPGLANVRALDRARCYSQTQVADLWNGRGDFFKIRDITLTVPVTSLVPGSRNATLTLSAHNIRLWAHEDARFFDSEQNSDISALTFGPAAELTPAPRRFTASIRTSF